ncbi:MAG: ATP-dependent DNA helicase RecG [Lachnospiraceae bacterium]
MNITNKIDQLKGVGPKISALFEKLNVSTIEDLLKMYPRNYLSYDNPRNIEDARLGERICIKATIDSYVEVKKVRSLTIVSCMVRDTTGRVKLTWFNCPFLKKLFHIGQTYVFVGTLDYKMGQLTIEHPEYIKVSDYEKMVQTLQPVYPLTEGLSNKVVTKTMEKALPYVSEINDQIPLFVREKYNLISITEAITGIHFPKNREHLVSCRKRLVFDEFFWFLVHMNLLKENTVRLQNHFLVQDFSFVDDFIKKLPFSLTQGQQNAIDEIKNDLSGMVVMNRLIQGDVGSGKTVVAQMAILAVVKNGYQAAFMVPTEVLAMQHFEDLSKDFADYGIKVALLVGSTKISEKRKIYEALASGEIDVVVGTHALIQDKVIYKKLALVITDEQHRFGVRQREKLSEKGESPHVLVMSATPIPRTLAIIMYGDLDISVMKDMPSMRKPIKNCVVGTAYRPTAYKFMYEQIKMGHQIYIICPMVESGEGLDIENVIEYQENLLEIFPKDVHISYLHGKMSSDEKNVIMDRFIRNEIQILVSTTVIEVGINNPNATVMMIENAERFGLAQLHQLRGRVGRGDAQSYCIFICGSNSEEAKNRLDILNHSNDGFYIANEDLKLRGPGDLFGVRQSGDMLFHLGDIYEDADVLKLASEAIADLKKESISLQSLLTSHETMVL